MLTTFCDKDPNRGSQKIALIIKMVGDSVTCSTRRMEALLLTSGDALFSIWFLITIFGPTKIAIHPTQNTAKIDP